MSCDSTKCLSAEIKKDVEEEERHVKSSTRAGQILQESRREACCSLTSIDLSVLM